MNKPLTSKTQTKIWIVENDRLRSHSDYLAVEEPLELRLVSPHALDKLIGSAFLANELPLSDRIVMVSGRSSFEILQKCIAAGVSIVCAVSAPSSLAVSLAKEFGVTLIGFLRGQRFNIYSGKERIEVLGTQNELERGIV